MHLAASFGTTWWHRPRAFFRAGPFEGPRQVRFQEFHVVLLLHISALVNQVLHLAASFGTTWWHRPWAFFRAGPFEGPRQVRFLSPPCRQVRFQEFHVVLLLHISALVNQV